MRWRRSKVHEKATEFLSGGWQGGAQLGKVHCAAHSKATATIGIAQNPKIVKVIITAVKLFGFKTTVKITAQIALETTNPFKI